MGNAVYCDRCGNLFNTREVNIKKGKLVGFWNEDLEVDLCPSCVCSLDEHVYGDDIKKKKKQTIKKKKKQTIKKKKKQPMKENYYYY